jgi:GAF domain-containing protein
LKPAFYPDLTKEKPKGYDGTMENYKTFIAVPVWASGNVYGMVTVDAPKPRSLVLEDKYVIEMFADVVSIAFERGMNVVEPLDEKTEAGDTLQA